MNKDLGIILSELKANIYAINLRPVANLNLGADKIIEEYFWQRAQYQKDKATFFHEFNLVFPDYFNLLVKRLSKEEATPAKFMAMRFIMMLAVESDNEINEPLIHITQLLSMNRETIDWNRHGIDYLVSQTISYLPLKILNEDYLKLLKRLVGLPNDISAYSITERLILRSINQGEVDLLEKLICEFVLQFKINDVGSIKPYIDPYKTLSFLESDAFKPMIEIVGIERIFGWLDQPISEINEKLPYEMSSISLPSIEDTDQLKDRHSFKYVLLKFIRDALEISSANTNLVLDKLWFSDYDIYRRLAIHTINFHYEDLAGIFWKKLGNPFNDSRLKHELFVLLQRHSSSFQQSEFSQIIEWLESIDIRKANEGETDDDLNRYKAVVIKEYLAALTDLDEEKQLKIDYKVAELDRINPARSEHPGYNIYSETKWGHDYPDTEEQFEIKSATTGSLAGYFNSNVDTWTKYEFEGQLERLRNKITFNPNFVNEVTPLLGLDIQTKSTILSGITKAIENKKTADVSHAFKIIDSELFKIPKVAIDINQEIFLSNTCWFVREIGKNDSLELSDEYILKAKDIILHIMKLENPLKQRNEDIIFDIINSVRGKAFESMLSLMLKNDRINPKGSDKWFGDIKEYYSLILKTGTQDECFLYSVAGHLPYFGYLDFNWLQDNIDLIFLIVNPVKWVQAMFFYVRLNSRVYGNLFKLLMSHGHYQLGIEVFTGSQKGINDFIKHVMICHLSNYEGQELSGENSLIEKVLNKGDKQQLKAVINFLYTNDGYDTGKILPIWERIMNAELASKERQEVLKSLPALISKIQRFDDETTEIIRKTITRIKGEFDKHRSLAQVLKFNEDLSDILQRAKVIMLLVAQFTDDFYKKEIEEFTRALYTKDALVANDFVNDLLSKRAFYLLEIYEEFNKHSA